VSGANGCEFVAEGARWYVASAERLAPGGASPLPLCPEKLLPGATERLGGKRGRTTLLVRGLWPGGRDVVAKYHWSRAWVEPIKYLFQPTRAAAEWANNRALQRAGVPTPVPLALAEERVAGLFWRRSVLVLEAIQPAISLTRFLDAESLGVRRVALDRLAEGVAGMHRAGYHHRDLHAGNVLVRAADTDPYPLVTDLHEARRHRSLGRERRVDDLARLSGSVRATAKERLRFLRRYLSVAERREWRAWADAVDAATRAIWTRWARKHGTNIEVY
jgi:tRNA A-37 threonylcarbamoyl transferase component Bud32